MLIIGISGKKYSGKNTVAEAISNYYRSKHKVELIAFADALKDEICSMYKISREYLEANKKHFRLILQGHGTDFRRNLCGDKYWIEEWLKKAYKSEADVVLVPDVRFNNEFEIIKEICGHVWRVERKEFELGGHKEVIRPPVKDEHPSETELDGHTFDVHIDNGGTIVQLQQDVNIKLAMLNYKI